MNRLARGALAGLAATVPMTVVMQGLHRRLPWHLRYPLEPRLIAERITRRLGLDQHMDEPDQRWAALACHFAYGSAAGAVYSSIMPPLRIPPATRGAAFGVLLWAAGYLGWLPAMGILEPDTRRPRRRAAIMVLSHLVWGAFAGHLADSDFSRSKQ